jgi:hypothetical protein
MQRERGREGDKERKTEGETAGPGLKPKKGFERLTDKV